MGSCAIRRYVENIASAIFRLFLQYSTLRLDTPCILGLHLSLLTPTVVTAVGISPLFVVCFSDDISKFDAPRIAKLDTEMFHDESWKPIYFGNLYSPSKWYQNRI